MLTLLIRTLVRLDNLANQPSWDRVVYRRIAALVAGIFTTVLISCGGGGDQAAGSIICDTQKSDAVLVVESVKNNLNDVALSSFRLTNVKFNNAPTDLPLLIPFDPKASISNAGIDCITACRIGSNEGSYSFTLSAPGFVAADFSVSASYANRVGNCPVVLSGGTGVNLRLNPI